MPTRVMQKESCSLFRLVHVVMQRPCALCAVAFCTAHFLFLTSRLHYVHALFEAQSLRCFPCSAVMMVRTIGSPLPQYKARLAAASHKKPTTAGMGAGGGVKADPCRSTGSGGSNTASQALKADTAQGGSLGGEREGEGGAGQEGSGKKRARPKTPPPPTSSAGSGAGMGAGVGAGRGTGRGAGPGAGQGAGGGAGRGAAARKSSSQPPSKTLKLPAASLGKGAKPQKVATIAAAQEGGDGGAARGAALKAKARIASQSQSVCVSSSEESSSSTSGSEGGSDSDFSAEVELEDEGPDLIRDRGGPPAKMLVVGGIRGMPGGTGGAGAARGPVSAGRSGTANASAARPPKVPVPAPAVGGAAGRKRAPSPRPAGAVPAKRPRVGRSAVTAGGGGAGARAGTCGRGSARMTTEEKATVLR